MRPGGPEGSALRPRALLHDLRPGLPPMRREADAPLSLQAVLSTLGIVVQGVVRFVYSVLIGNVLGRAVLGAVNAGISMALFASLLMPTAAAQAATKYVARARGADDMVEAAHVTRHLSRTAAIASLLAGIACVPLAPLLLGVGWLEAVLTGALVVTYSAYMFVRGFLFGAGMVVRATVWDVVSSAVAIVSLVLVLFAGAQPWLLLPLVVGYGLYAVVNVPHGSSGSLPRELRSEINGFVGLNLINSVATGGFLQLCMVGAQHWDPADAGYFAAALTLATPASLVARSLSLVLFPSLAAAHGRGDREGVRRQTDVSTRALAVLSLATYGPLMLLSPALIHLVFPRPGFAEAALLLPVLLGATMVLNVVAGATNNLLTREHQYTRIVVFASVGGALVGIVWWLLRAPSGGVGQIAAGYLVGTLLVALVPAVTVWRLDRLHWWGLAIRFTVGSLAAAALVRWEQATDAGLLTQVGLALGFALLWLLVSWKDTRLLLGMLPVPRRGRS